MTRTMSTSTDSSSSRSRFLPSMPKLRWAPGRFMGMSRRQLMKIEPTEGEDAKVKPCVDSMRSSSPTQARPGRAAAFSGSPQQNSGM
ncbi:hypothetical protein CRG98_023069, partial [Punica granatum]